MPARKQRNLRSKNVIIRLEHGKDVFTTFWPFKSHDETADLQGVQDLRHLLSNEKARILFTIKSKNPESIYGLAKLLGRDFKSVREDVKSLDKFGLINLKLEGKTRKKLRPVLALDELNILLKI